MEYLSLQDHVATNYLQNRTTGIHLEPQLKPEYKATVPQIEELFARTAVWHGTGRYQHGENGEKADILQGIVSSGGLDPQLDTWDFVNGPMHSISVAPSRMYARAYALRFSPPREKPSNLYGKNMWLRNVGATIALRLIRDTAGKMPSIIEQRAEHFRIARRWREKTSLSRTSKTQSMLKFFSQTSDIPDNYPVLFGIQGDALNPTEIASYLKRHEIRTQHPIPIDQFTHVEVPYKNVEETKAIVGSDLPVVPIEFAEEFCKGFSFATLARGGPLIK